MLMESKRRYLLSAASSTSKRNKQRNINKRLWVPERRFLENYNVKKHRKGFVPLQSLNQSPGCALGFLLRR